VSYEMNSILLGRKALWLSSKMRSNSIDVRWFSSIEKYNHLDIERKWQKYWDENQTFVTKRRPGHSKKYILDMFPYPSGIVLQNNLIVR
jgi:hypothetical protein